MYTFCPYDTAKTVVNIFFQSHLGIGSRPPLTTAMSESTTTGVSPVNCKAAAPLKRITAVIPAVIPVSEASA